jgi:hypothetical protein
MRYLALATDYDGTIARHGVVSASTLAALARFRASGRRRVLVTGRELDDIVRVFPELDWFDRVVAENGAILYTPSTQAVRHLTEPPSSAFLAELRNRGVPVSVGRRLVATVQPHEGVVLDVIRDLGLEWHIIFNKGAVMILPAGVTKATGLVPALAELGIPPERVIGVGDAENDHAFLSLCGCAVAVAGAIPSLKERADLVTTGEDGDGVAELIGRVLRDDLRGIGRAPEEAEA